MDFNASVNPETLQYNNIKIGDKVAIEMSAWNWIEVAANIHAHFASSGNHYPESIRYLIGKIFEALTPEDYRKALVAEYAEAQQNAMRSHPLYQMSRMMNGGDDIEVPDPEDFREGGEDATD